MTTENPRTESRVPVPLSADLREIVLRNAEQQHRSLGQQLVYYVELGLIAEKQGISLVGAQRNN